MNNPIASSTDISILMITFCLMAELSAGTFSVC